VLWKLPNVRLAPDVIFTIPGLGFPVTNTLLCTWISIIVLFFMFYGARKGKLIPSGWQNAMEWMIEALLGLVEGVVGKERGRKFFPLVATFFLFILVSNLLDVIPGVDTVGQIDGEAIRQIDAAAHANYQPVLGFLLFGPISNALIPWIRPATTDLNLNLSMALIAVIVAQVFGFRTLGAGEHLSKYFNFKALLSFSLTGFIEFFVGLLEIISEIARVISLTFRLFGNIFAGSVVLAVFAFILPFLADVIFIPFELFVAVVQAFVFALLTLTYLQLATTSHEHAESEHEAREEVAHNEEIAKEKAVA
jgi:F-type H+-transporting ATPase subunit a